MEYLLFQTYDTLLVTSFVCPCMEFLRRAQEFLDVGECTLQHVQSGYDAGHISMRSSVSRT
jgi:hypothetical protein